MYEPCILKKDLQYSCDLCGELPITGKRWCCNVCEDFDVCDSCHTASLQMRERGASHPGPHSADHPMAGHSAVMADAIQRWFVDTLRNAKNGDINQAALLAEMLATGYGCNKDLDEAGASNS